MGIYITFEKIGEEQSGVRYRFGYFDSDMSRTLMFKTGEEDEPTPDDGVSDREFLKAATKIWKMWDETGEWPAQGAYASG